MTRVAGTRDPQRPAMTAPPQRARKTQNALPWAFWPIPGSGSPVGAAAILITARLARQDRVGYCEAQAFQAVNGLPARSTVPSGSSCSWARSAPLPRQPARRRWRTTASSPAACSRAGRAPGPGRSWSNSWCACPASGTGQRHPHPRPRCFRARVPVRARGRRGRAGHGCLPAPSPPGRAVVAAAVPIVGLSRIYVGVTSRWTLPAGRHLAWPSALPWPSPGSRAATRTSLTCHRARFVRRSAALAAIR